MGTRADFYIGRGENAEWLGSIAWDGYPNGITKTLAIKDGFGCHKHEPFEDGKHLFDSVNGEVFRGRLLQFFQNREDVTLPEMGWPWPWETSSTTDYAYAFDDGKVYGSCFGSEWFDPHKEPEEHRDGKFATFPNMTSRKAVTLGKRSGLMVFGG